jgi:hypothetical protein
MVPKEGFLPSCDAGWNFSGIRRVRQNMCCLRSRSEHASMRVRHATPSTRREKVPVANENHPHRAVRAEKQRPARWRDIGILITVAPTLTIITLIASYFFGLR